MREGRVRADRINPLAIRPARGRLDEILAQLGIHRAEIDQLQGRVYQEIIARGGDVESLDREHVNTIAQQGGVLGEIKFLKLQGPGVWIAGVSLGIPGQLGWRRTVGIKNSLPIEKENKTIIVLHAKHHGVDRRAVSDIEGRTNVDRTVHAVHGLLYIGPYHRSKAPGGVGGPFETDTEGALAPGRIIKCRSNPVEADGRVRGNMNPHSGLGIDNPAKFRVCRQPPGNIGHLARILRRESCDNIRAIGSDQRQQLSLSLKLEVGMKLRVRQPTILVRGENQEVAAGAERHIGKLPLRKILEIVGQLIAGKIDRRVAVVVELDPIAVLTILIL